jgi:hypothetical protein
MRKLSKTEKQSIIKEYGFPLGYVVVDYVTKFGDPLNSLEYDVEYALTWRYKGFITQYGDKK